MHPGIKFRSARQTNEQLGRRYNNSRMEQLDKELIKAICDAITAVSSVIAALLMLVLIWLRGKDKKAHDTQLSVLAGKLQVLTQGFDENATKDQAEKVIDAVYTNAAHTLTYWLISYIKSGKPKMTEGDWNLSLVIHSQWIMVKSRLDVFKYKEQSLGSYVKEDSFNKLCDELTKGVQTFDNTGGVSKYVANKLDELKVEVTGKLS
jgi:hypothetical protein